jgi:hypothetical protein
MGARKDVCTSALSSALLAHSIPIPVSPASFSTARTSLVGTPGKLKTPEIPRTTVNSVHFHQDCLKVDAVDCRYVEVSEFSLFSSAN